MITKANIIGEIFISKSSDAFKKWATNIPIINPNNPPEIDNISISK